MARVNKQYLLKIARQEVCVSIKLMWNNNVQPKIFILQISSKRHLQYFKGGFANRGRPNSLCTCVYWTWLTLCIAMALSFIVLVLHLSTKMLIFIYKVIEEYFFSLFTFCMFQCFRTFIFSTKA
jgi:hypothetical protein